MFRRNRDTVVWRQDGLHERKLGIMGIVAVDAVVALARTSREIPVSVHPAVAAVQIVTHGSAMTLGTKGHHIREGDTVSIGKI